MTNNELKLLQSAMDHSKSYLEFGSGNSTYMAVATDNIKKITVVESDVTFWETHLMSTPAIYEAVEKGRLHLMPWIFNKSVSRLNFCNSSKKAGRKEACIAFCIPFLILKPFSYK